MQKRQIGKSSLQVPVLCLGGNVFGWTVNEQESFRLLDAALDAGLNFVDTADVYSRWVSGHAGGESETVIGKWFARSGRRSQVILATKLGMDMGNGKKGLSRKYIAEEIEASLSRLQTDYIDLYQAHSDDAETPLEETLDAFDRLVKQGKVRVIGASNYKGARLKEALEISRKHHLARYESLQPNYSLVERAEFERDLLPVVKEYGIGVIPYFSLAAGFLTGKYRSKQDAAGKARGPIVEKYLNDRGFAVVNALDSVAAELKSTPARVALAWLMARPGITAPIASATSLDQLNDLAEATRLTLPASAIAQLDRASDPARKAA
ncbi:MAG TPA: aldo/keto reductase [Acidobacteriaceae bacterium]|jgi:aryl-alcohol dehydrogenase-like predicted oxidoreductase